MNASLAVLDFSTDSQINPFYSEFLAFWRSLLLDSIAQYEKYVDLANLILPKKNNYRTRISELNLMISKSKANSTKFKKLLYHHAITKPKTDSKIHDWNKNNMLLDDRITEYNQRMEK
ncbi:hypothetical protein BB560_006119, partial [Smittium megazygosporum]